VKALAMQGFSVERVPGINPARPARRVVPGVAAWYIRPRSGPKSTITEHATSTGARKTLLCKAFSVERVTGIEPAWPAWKTSGTPSD